MPAEGMMPSDGVIRPFGTKADLELLDSPVGTGACTWSVSRQGMAMLVLSRKKDEKIIIGDTITVMVIDIRGDKVRLGIDAPRDVTVHRQEVYEAIRKEREAQANQSREQESMGHEQGAEPACPNNT